MFSKVLIANRGAIATRILRTLKKLNITSVAVYAECDAKSLHVSLADEAYSLGEGNAAATYLNTDKLLQICKASGAQAIHPGYGFLSENTEFVKLCEHEGIVFIGPTPEQIQCFGLKHEARRLALAACVPLLPGSELLTDVNHACEEANRIGYPVMLKSTAGGGGIGMQLCYTQETLQEAFDKVKRLGANNFSDDGVFLEKFVQHARHIEVQVFGDAKGTAIAIGERDCSSQRRNQKVVEECPAPHLSDATRQALYDTAESLLASVNYRNAGTVEFIYDTETQDFYFLEVNTRLQVEHGVTEAVYGIDLVEWMLRQASGEAFDLQQAASQLKASGHAVQVRLYAEDPYLQFKPCAGFLSEVFFPEGKGIRIDHWIESGMEIPPYFDPMLAKVIVHDTSREAALAKLNRVLHEIKLYGSETNLAYLRALTADAQLQAGRVTTQYLNHFTHQCQRIDVLHAGTQTTLQDFPGRQGYWHVGIPPSGPFDSYSFRLGNRLLNNPESAVGLEITLQGPSLVFSAPTQVVITGADVEVKRNNQLVALWEVINLEAGDTLNIGRIATGARCYLCVRGGIQCPDYLGSASTFTLGQFGGHNGRALQVGDVLALSADVTPIETPASLAKTLKPQIQSTWDLRVIYGPQGAPDFFTPDDIQTFFANEWEVHYNSSRTGVRLIGPKPQWARRDGGEAGLHPSNIHDNAYAFGAVDFTGDMPVILGPDGPSLGGFVSPATVITADLWKLGQLRSGDKVRFIPIALADAVSLEALQTTTITSLTPPPPQEIATYLPETAIFAKLPSEHLKDELVIRLAGDHFMLVEYGEQHLDLGLRFKVHALMQWLYDQQLDGLRELTPGVRSLQIHYDAQVMSAAQLVEHLKRGEEQLRGRLNTLKVPSRIVHLPLSWNDDACQLAIDKYSQSVRKNAPWCPSNLEFIRRINGLPSIEAVKDIVFSASYLVMGLGDVYLGAPLATPIDPRHRLVTTKYNPARTWTAENSVGIGGAYLCIYGMEGPGGYQFVGRTLQMWNRYRKTAEFQSPWLLRFFDQIRFYEVSADELIKIRRDFPQGQYPLTIEEREFSLADYQAWIESEAEAIATFNQQREAAFEAELSHWHATDQFDFHSEETTTPHEEHAWPEDSLIADSPVSGSVWEIKVDIGDRVQPGQLLVILESMKMEIPIFAQEAGEVTQLLIKSGTRVRPGQALVVMQSIVC